MRYCIKCGAEVSDDGKFCPVCGFPMTQEAAQGKAEEKVAEDFQNMELGAQKVDDIYAAPVYETVSQVEAPQVNAGVSVVQAAEASGILKFGILGIAFCGFVTILGIIFGAIARKKGKAYMAQYGLNVLSGKAKVGYILGKAAIILGIIMTVVWFIYIVIAVAAGVSGLYSYY